ncbi:MAG: ATP-binding cassette domain-containing protein [Planctomycetaceae bacterium]
MAAPAKPDRASEADLMSASWIFEQLALQDGLHVDRSKTRRAVDEAAETYFGIQDGGWWRWIIETAHSLGRGCRVIDGELHDLIQMARNGLTVILRSGDGNTWHSIMPGKGRKLYFGTPRGVLPVRIVTRQRVASLLRLNGFEGVVRCVVIEPPLSPRNAELTGPSEKKPLDRLISLLIAESSDLWVVVVFALVAGMLSMTTPLAVEALVNTVAFGRFLQPVIVLSIMLLAFLVFQAAVKALQTFVVEIIQRRLFARVAADLSFRLPRVRIDALDDHYAPELVNRFFDVVTVQKISAQLLLDGISVILNIAVGMTVLAFYHPYLLAFDVVLILLLLFTVFVLGRGAVKTSVKESKTKYAMAAWLEDLARCRTTFRYDGASEFALERSDQLVFNYLSARKKHFKVLMRQVLFLLLVQALASTALLAIGGWLVIDNQLSLGQLVAAELIVAVVVGSFAKLGKHIESFYDLMASIDKLGVLLDLPTERTDGLLTVPDTNAAEQSGITVDQVCYQTSDRREILNNVSIKLISGQHIALSGESGTGKSLLLDLLFGLREPSSGAVRINGIVPRDLRPDVLRRQVALARDVEIFDGTIAENIHLERPDVSVNDVRNAAEISGLLTAIQRLPNGLETPLNAAGSPLTSSQLRRLILARALAGNPKILLIDELLDSMADEEAERILKSLLEADPGRSIVLVTNREKLQAIVKNVVMLTSGHEEREAQ